MIYHFNISIQKFNWKISTDETKFMVADKLEVNDKIIVQVIAFK